MGIRSCFEKMCFKVPPKTVKCIADERIESERGFQIVGTACVHVRGQ